MEDRDPAQAQAGGVGWRGKKRVCRESPSAIVLAFERTSTRYKGNGMRRVDPRMNKSGRWDSACRVIKAPWDIRSIGLMSLGNLEDRSFRPNPSKGLKHVTGVLFLSLAPLGFTIQTGRGKVQILLIYKPRGKRISSTSLYKP